MVDDIGTELQAVVRCNEVLKIDLPAEVLDPGTDLILVRRHPDTVGVRIVAVRKRGVREELSAEQMVPPGRRRGVAPVKADHIGVVEIVPPEISRKKDPVVLPERVIGLRIEIVEVQPGTVDGGIRG